MSKSDILAGDNPRIGCVPYLNARPLIEGLTYPFIELVPSRLFDSYQAGECDAALISSIDALAMSTAELVDGISISSRGDVYSVILAYEGELKALEKVQLDPASHTSNALLQILLGEFHGLRPEYVRFSEEKSDFQEEGLPRLLIGDRAIAFRNRTSPRAGRILDLGGEWFRQTGLPFVFALWVLGHEFMEKKFLADRLRVAKELGLSKRAEIASRTVDPIFALRYFSEWIRYDLGDEEKRGLGLFGELLQKYQLVESGNFRMTYW